MPLYSKLGYLQFLQNLFSAVWIAHLKVPTLGKKGHRLIVMRVL